MSAVDDEIRDEFRRRAAAGGSAEDLRAQVRAAMVASSPKGSRRTGPRSLVAASVLVLGGGLAGALVWIGAPDTEESVAETQEVESALPPVVTRPRTSESVTDEDPVESSAVEDPVAATNDIGSTSPVIPIGSSDDAPSIGTRRIESVELRTQASFDVPADDERFVVVADTSNVLEVSLAGPSALPPPTVPMVRIVVPNDATSAVDVESALSGPHSDTIVTGVTDSKLGKYDARSIRIESDRGTTAVGFTVADQVFVAADGIDRTYEVLVIETEIESEPLIVWIDASSAEFAQARMDASMIVDSLRLVAS